MIPVSPATEFVRSERFVHEEWTDVLALTSIVADNLMTNPWLSLLYTNYATVDPQTAMEKLQTVALDDGLTRSWALYMAASRMGLNGVEWYVPLPARPYLPPAVFLPPLVDSKPSIRFVIALRCIDDGIFTYFVECVHINNDGGGGGVFSFARYLHLTVKLARHLLDSLRASPEHHELAHLHIPHPYQVWLVGRKRAAVLVLELLRYAFDTPRILADPILHDCLDLKLMERQTLLELAFQMHVSRQRLAQVRHKAMRQMRTVVHAMHIHDWEYASVAARLMELRHMYDCSQPLRLPLVIFDHDMASLARIAARQSSWNSLRRNSTSCCRKRAAELAAAVAMLSVPVANFIMSFATTGLLWMRRLE
ncbi:unnamed protein product [Aphanomyces euteiches]